MPSMKYMLMIMSMNHPTNVRHPWRVTHHLASPATRPFLAGGSAPCAQAMRTTSGSSTCSGPGQDRPMDAVVIAEELALRPRHAVASANLLCLADAPSPPPLYFPPFYALSSLDDSHAGF